MFRAGISEPDEKQHDRRTRWSLTRQSGSGSLGLLLRRGATGRSSTRGRRGTPGRSSTPSRRGSAFGTRSGGARFRGGSSGIRRSGGSLGGLAQFFGVARRRHDGD